MKKLKEEEEGSALCTYEVERTGRNPKTGKMGTRIHTEGIFKNSHNYILKYRGKIRYYSDFNFLGLMRDIVHLKVIKNLENFDLNHVEEVHKKAMKMVDVMFEVPSLEIKRLNLENANLKDELVTAESRIKGYEEKYGKVKKGPKSKKS